MNGSFWEASPVSIWRQEPSPAVDEAWEEISAFSYHTISTADVIALGKDPRTTVKAPLSWGNGPDAHIVQLDVFHQIHCLDSLRRAAFHDYYYPNSTTGVDGHGTGEKHQLYRPHLKHCLHMLVQNLMCTANVDVITHNWVESQRHPFPDFSINHKCRDFEAVRKWSAKDKIETKDMVENMEIPEDAVVLPLDQQLLELLNEIE